MPPGAAAQQQAMPPVPDAYVVLTRGNDSNEVVIRTLAGEYKEDGSNHGRKVYKKTSEGTPDSVDVYMYYWDERDGPAFAGWWFGNKLGGTQVWSHNDSAGMVPPASGWKIPWDGAVRPTLAVISKAEHMRAQSDSKMKAISSGLAAVLPTAAQTLAEAETIAGDYANPDQLKAAEQILMPQLAILNEAMRKVTESQKGVVGEAATHVASMVSQLRASQGNVTAVLTKLRSHKAQVEQAAKDKEAEERDRALLAELMQESSAKSNAAEDAVEKAMITYEMVEAGGDDLGEVGQAVTETEKAAAEANKAVGEARIYFNAKLASLKKFETDNVRAEAQSGLNKLQSQLHEDAAKLGKLRNVRQEFQQRAQAQQLVAEVLEKLTPSEVDTDRAEEATMLLATDALSQDLMQQAHQAMAKASDALASTAKFIAQKKANATGLSLEEVTKLEERIVSSQKRLVDLKSAHKEAKERLVAQALDAEATEKLQAVAEAINQAADAEAPFLMGVEELPLDETTTAVQACESAATKANTACAWAKTYIGTKLVEVRRFSAGPAGEAQERLQEFNKQLDAHIKRLHELKQVTADRKRKAMLREVEREVAHVEALAKKASDTAAAFTDDQKLYSFSEEDIRKAAGDTAQIEQEAGQAMVDAKKFLTARQIEAKSKKTGSISAVKGLAPLQSRLNRAVTELAKYKDVFSSIEARLLAKKAINEAQTRFESAKDRVNKVVALVEALGEPGVDTETGLEEQASVKASKHAEGSVAEAGVALKATERFVESQARQSVSAQSAPAELLNLLPLLQAERGRLEALSNRLQERQDKLAVAGIVNESSVKVQESEEKAAAAWELWKKLSKEEAPAEEVVAILEEFEAALTAANSTVGSVKTFLAMKRIAAKRLAGSVASYTSEELSRLQRRLEVAVQKTTDMKKGLGERKNDMVKQEVVIKLAAVEKAVEEANAATTILLKDAPAEGGAEAPEAPEQKELDPEEMKKACERSDKAQAAAHQIVESTIALLQNRHKDAKSGLGADPSLLAEISKALDKVTKLQTGLDKLRSQLRDQEHRFVAGKLFQDAIKNIEQLEKKLEEVNAVCAPAFSGDSNFCLDAFKFQVLGLLKARVRSSPKGPQALFEEMGAAGGKLTADQFVAFTLQLIEGGESGNGIIATDAQLKAAFGSLAGSDAATEMVEATFLGYFRSLYRCVGPVSMTETMTVKGGKIVRKLQKGELIEALSKPEKEENLGLMRIRAKAEKDGLEGFVTISGNQGSRYLEEYEDNRSKADAAVEELAKAVADTMRQIETRVEELRSVRSGPLAETKVQLIKLKVRITKVQQSQTGLVKRMYEARKKHEEAMAAEKRRRQDAADRAAAEKVITDVKTHLELLVKGSEHSIQLADALIRSKCANEQNPVEAVAKAETALEDTMETAERAMEAIRSTLDALKGSTTKASGEARNLVLKHKVKVGGIDTACRKQLLSLRNVRLEVAEVAHQAVVAAVRKHAEENSLGPDAFFKELSKGEKIVAAADFRTFLEGLASDVTSPQLDLALERYSAGVTRFAVCGMLQEYKRVVKDIAVTSASAVKDGKSLRKILIGEIVEVLESGSRDETGGLPRVRCHALKDGTEGWVTLRGNQGTAFLEACPKPFYSFAAACPLTVAFESTSELKRTAQAGEVVELLGGPKTEASQDVERVRVKVVKDGEPLTGWMTFKDAAGAEYLESKKLLVCKQSIAITTAFDIAAGKASRKLDKDETLEIIEEARYDEKKGLYRVKARATRDKTEGWMTIKGNAGTTYSEESDKHYMCTKASPLEARFTSGSAASRSLEEGEIVELLEGPKTEVKEGLRRVKGRDSNGDEVWFALTPTVLEWSPTYACEAASSLHDGPSSSSAQSVRDLQARELLDALDMPFLDASTKEVRVHVRAQKDGAVGFATVVDAEKTVLLVDHGS